MQDLFQLSDNLLRLQGLKKDLERNLRECKDGIESTEAKMVKIMVSEEVQNFKRSDRTFYMKSRLFASILDENKEEVIEWFKGHEEYSGMVKEQINANTLSSWAKERQEEEDMPEEIESRLSIYEKTSIGVRSN